MYVILNTEYFDESVVETKVIGYFTSYELAEQYLFENDYKLDEYYDYFFGNVKCYNKESEFEYTSWTSEIGKLDLIK